MSTKNVHMLVYNRKTHLKSTNIIKWLLGMKECPEWFFLQISINNIFVIGEKMFLRNKYFCLRFSKNLKNCDFLSEIFSKMSIFFPQKRDFSEILKILRFFRFSHFQPIKKSQHQTPTILFIHTNIIIT